MSEVITGADAKRAREALGASQTAVAAAIGVNRTYYSLFEAGRYVLDEQEQRRLREFLADAPAAPTYRPAAADHAADDPPPMRGSSRAPTTPASTPDPQSSGHATAAVRALNLLRSSAAEPNGLRSKRTATSVHDAMTALQPLEYTELLAIARDRAVPTAALPSFEKFKDLDLAEMTLWESRAAGLLICDALYGGRWNAIHHRDLLAAADDLRETLGEDGIEYSGVTFVESLSDNYDARTPLRRAELAPSVVRAAEKRGAPMLRPASNIANSVRS